MIGIIYKAIHLKSGRVYVGQTYSLRNRSPEELLRDRRTRHLRSAANSNSSKAHFHQALRKYGVEAFAWEIIATADSLEELNRLESRYISLLNSSSDKNGFNSRLEGDNRTFAGETKRKMAIAARSRWVNAPPSERVKLLAKQQQGRDKNPDIRIRASARMKSMRADPIIAERMASRRRQAIQSKEFREKRSVISKTAWSNIESSKKAKIIGAMRASPIRLANQLKAMQTIEYRNANTKANRDRRKRPFIVMRIDSGEEIARFENIVDAARCFGNPAPNISATLNGIAKTFKPTVPNFKTLGRLTARWLGDPRPIERRFESLRKAVDILTAHEHRLVKTFHSRRDADAALGTQVGSVLHGRTKTFTAKNEPYNKMGRLIARWAAK